MITKFYQKRVPFIIYIVGTECMGKSTLVTQLGERINMTNIVSTSIVKTALEYMDIDLPPIEKNDGDDEFAFYKQQCRRIRNGCNFDIQKCFVDGKPLIIEGSHLDPEVYLRLDEIEEQSPTGGSPIRKEKLFITSDGGEQLQTAAICKMR